MSDLITACYSTKPKPNCVVLVHRTIVIAASDSALVTYTQMYVPVTYSTIIVKNDDELIEAIDGNYRAIIR